MGPSYQFVKVNFLYYILYAEKNNGFSKINKKENREI